MSTKHPGEVVRAAGGLIWVRGLNSRKIVIIHRKAKRGNDWTLPKGHLKLEGPKDEENWQEAALREAHEETLCKQEDLKIESIAGPISYMVEGKPKIVLYFNMNCLSDYEFNRKINNHEEVDEVKLVDVGEALDLLTYPKERSLIREIESLMDECSTTMKPVLLLGLRKVFKTASHRRLNETLGPFELELRCKIRDILERKPNGKNGKDEKLYNEEKQRVRRRSAVALESLECSKKALYLGQIEVGWRYLFQADLEVKTLDSNQESLRRVAQVTLYEAEKKLRSWRLETVQNYLGKNGVLKEQITIEDVYQARKIIQEHFTNIYIKLRTAGFQLGILNLIALSLVFPLVFLLPTLSSMIGFNNFGLLVAVVMMGALGGCFSGIFSLSREAGEGRIPEQILSSWVTISRPVVGVLAALAMSGFLLSGIVQLGSLTIPLLLAVSFAVGFSERLLVKAMELRAG